MRKRILITILMVIILGIFYIILFNFFTKEYKPSNDEIALHLKLNTKEDVGLIVFDYQANNHQYSGGISNADRTPFKNNSDNIQVWSKDELNSNSDSVEMTIKIRIITSYVDPNYENIYPEELTKYIDSISWKAYFGQSYYITITGDKHTGYKAVLSK